MSPDALVRMVLFSESLMLVIGVLLLVAHAAWWWWYDRWSAGRVDAHGDHRIAMCGTLMAMIALITPPIAVVLGIVFKGERLGVITMTGGALVLLGVFLYQQAERRGL